MTKTKAKFKISIFFQAVEENGIWSLVITRVGHSDAGNYECQTNSEIKGSVTVNLDIKGINRNNATYIVSNLVFSNHGYQGCFVQDFWKEQI